MNWEDPDLISEFLVEAEEHLDELDNRLLEVEQEGLSEKSNMRITGTFHTLKGMASYVEFGEIQQLCHLTETLLQQRSEGAPGSAAQAKTDIAFEVVTLLRTLLAEVATALEQGEPPPPDNPGLHTMLRRLERLTRQQVSRQSARR